MSVIINKEEYEIIKELPRGGFGRVYKLKKNGKFYAYKKILIIDSTQEQINQYTEEAKILSGFNSEYIVKYYFSFLEKDYFNILMEYGGDYNLKQLIQNYKKKNQLIQEKIIKDFIIQICSGLRDIHRSNLIHRDLTPENIFIDQNNRIKIGDFGVSKQLSTNTKYAKTDTGKLYYKAPEVIKGEKYDNRADIYSLGCIIYELFTLNEYFVDVYYDDKEGKINTDLYDPKWQKLIESLLKKKYKERPFIEKVFNRLKCTENKIILIIRVENDDIHDEIFFLDGDESHNTFKEINESNTKIYINNVQYKFCRSFIPKVEGLFTIEMEFNFSLKNCQNMFYYCKKIESIDISSFDTQNVSNMSYMFYYCCNLKNIDLSSFDTQNVKDMSYMFSNCYSLRFLDLSSFNTKNVINMEYMFKESYYLENINLSSFDTKNVKYIKGMFYYCPNLKSIDLSSFDTKNVEDMTLMFYNCESLKSINLSSLDTTNVKIMKGMFKNCKNLKSLDLSTLNTENVIDMSYLFYNCNKIENINFSSFVTKNVKDMSHMFYGCYELENIDLSSFDTKNVIDMSYLFYDCCNLKSIDLNAFNSKKVKDMSYMFSNCRKLKTIDLFSFDTTNVQSFHGMFSWCKNLEIINLFSFNIENISNMSYMFIYCENLRNIDLSSFNKVFENMPDMGYMFSNCHNLESLDLSSIDIKYEGFLYQFRNIFQECNALSELKIKKKVYNAIPEKKELDIKNLILID